MDTRVSSETEEEDADESVLTEEEKCKLSQQLYWAILQILDTDDDGYLTTAEFGDAELQFIGDSGFGGSTSLVAWYEDNALYPGSAATTIYLVEAANQGSLSNEDFRALYIILQWCDAYHSINPSKNGDGWLEIAQFSIGLQAIVDEL